MTFHVSVILLAAGRSQRMGSSKPLLPLGEKLIIHHCLDNLLAAELTDITVVTRQDSVQIFDAISSYTVRNIINPDSQSDMAGSIRCGLADLNPKTTGLLITLVDHPLVQPSTLRKLHEYHLNSPNSILLPVYHHKRGHPALFPVSLIKDIFKLPTLRDIVRNNRSTIREVEVDDRGVILDTDTPEDYKKLQEYHQNL